MGVGIAGEQERLEEQQADGPDSGRTAEPRQDRLGDHGLDLEEEEGACEDRGGVDEGEAAVGCVCGRFSVLSSHANSAAVLRHPLPRTDADAIPEVESFEVPLRRVIEVELLVVKPGIAN